MKDEAGVGGRRRLCWLLAPAFVACTSLLGLEKGHDACPAYCEQVQAGCTEADQTYFNEQECLALCPHFVQTGSDANSLECRALHASTISDATEGPREVCAAAGRMGGIDGASTCGSACEAYCQLMESVCPGVLPDAAGCVTACAGLPNEGVFNARSCLDGGDEYDGDTLRCRMWHVGAAALALQAGITSEQTRHCGHASGEHLCVGVRDETCGGARTPPAP